MHFRSDPEVTLTGFCLLCYASAVISIWVIGPWPLLATFGGVNLICGVQNTIRKCNAPQVQNVTQHH